jgi:light-regulated signal transduction histidine kinase (bacteriophytochrome)
MALTLELEQRVDERTAELRAAHAELETTNSDLMQLTLELEDRVTTRTAELEAANETLAQSSIAALNMMEDAVEARKQAEKASVELREEIAERKRAEAEILRLNAELEQRVRERTAELEVANQELEAFSYSVSHDLRAPLRSIDGFSRILLEDYPDKLDAEGKDSLKRVRAASQRMGELIDDLLKLSHASRTEMRRTEVDLTALAGEIAAELRRDDPARQGRWVIAPGLVATGDPQLLREVLENLLGNAWKFTGKRADPVIEFGVTNGEAVRAFFVRDNGAGFDMAYAGKLFGAFQRLHATADFPGTGIGLATVQRIIHRHGGRVWAEGAVGQGATFYFTLGAQE